MAKIMSRLGGGSMYENPFYKPYWVGEDELEHYGVKGMKWKRKKIYSLQKNTNKQGQSKNLSFKDGYYKDRTNPGMYPSFEEDSYSAGVNKALEEINEKLRKEQEEKEKQRKIQENTKKASKMITAGTLKRAMRKTISSLMSKSSKK